MNENIYCLCGEFLEINNFEKHFKKCESFKQKFNEFDYKICLLLKQFSDKREHLTYIKYLFKSYIKLIDYILNKLNYIKQQNTEENETTINEDKKENNNNNNKINYCIDYENKEYYNIYKQKYCHIIKEIENLYQIEEKDIIHLLMNATFNANLTIFEFMNLVHREVQIIKTINSFNLNRPKLYGPDNDIDIYEENNVSYIDRQEINNVIKNYKVFYFNNNIDKLWLYKDITDKRRSLKKDEDNNYNYIPLLIKDNNYSKSIYARNINELSYHPLFYKTIMCKHCNIMDNNSENILCPYAHNILKDFRLIYDYTDEKIIKFMKLLSSNNNLFKFVNYLNYIPWDLSPSEFNIDYYKVHQCQIDFKCPNKDDYQLCPFYHANQGEKDEYRRPPLLFRYKGKKCIKIKNKGPKKCDSGIFCQYTHNENEYNYHPDNYKKIKFQNIKIKYYKCCYGIHSEENTDAIKEIIKCRKCKSIPKNNKFCYFYECKHFVCHECFKKIKEIYFDNIILICPFCENKIEKGKVILIDFSEKK